MRDITFAASRNHGGGAEAMALWGPKLAAVFSKLLGCKLTFLVADDYEHLLMAVERGDADVSWLPPLLQPRAEAAGARIVVVTQRGGWLTYRAAVLVQRDGPLKDAASLRNIRAAWVDPHSASGYFFPRLELQSQGCTFASETFYGSPERTLAAVASGVADVCACFVSNPTSDHPARAAEDVARSAGPHAASLRILHVTDQIPPDGIAVGPRVPPADAVHIEKMLASMHEDEPGKSVLRELLHADRFVVLTDSLRSTLRSWMSAASSRAIR